MLGYASPSSSQLTYNAGRGGQHSTVGGTGFMRFNNTKVALCNVGLLHWGGSPELVGLEAHDIMRSATIFGTAWVNNMLVTCRTRNNPTVPGVYWSETEFTYGSMAAFQWYDTGQVSCAASRATLSLAAD